MLGLLGAITTYDGSLGVPFRPYGIRRVYGQMIDAVRKLDPVPHPTRRVLRQAERAGERLSQELGRQCTDHELSAVIGLSPNAIMILRARVASMQQPRHLDERVAGDEHDPLSLADTIPGGIQPDEALDVDEAQDALRRRLLRDLTPMQLEVCMSFAVDELSYREIGETHGLSFMEVMAIIGQVETRLGARDDTGVLVPITPKRKEGA